MTGSCFHEGDGRRNGGVGLENPDGAAALQRFEQVECAIRITGLTQFNNDHCRFFLPGFFGRDDWPGRGCGKVHYDEIPERWQVQCDVPGG